MHRMLLHACKLEFRHPCGEAMSLRADLDETWRAVIDRFGWRHSVLDQSLLDRSY
jgi:tRNA pseudouridine65 synthase